MSNGTEKVYVITACDTQTVPWAEAIKNTFALERDIAILAKKSGAAIHFHRYKNMAVGTPPAVLLECADDFLEKVKKLPAFNSVYQINTGAKIVETVRSSDMQQIDPPKNSGPKL